MKKTTLLNNVKYVLLGIVVAIGLSYVVQAVGTWNPAPSQVGTNNPELPLNIGTLAQVKAGGLSVNTFSAMQNALFDGSVFFNGVLRAPSVGGTIAFGGGDANGVEHNVGLVMNGAFSNTGTATSAPLSNQSLSTICADATGTIVLCDPSVAVTPPAITPGTFHAYGQYSNSEYTGFAQGNCNYIYPAGEWPSAQFYNLFGTSGYCASRANNDDGSGNTGFDVQLGFDNVVANSIGSGFFPTQGGFVKADRGNRPAEAWNGVTPSYWTVPAAGYYQIDLSGTVTIETKNKDGESLVVSGFFMRAEKGNDPHQFYEYPITDLPNHGIKAVMDGDGCLSGTILQATTLGDGRFYQRGKVYDANLGSNEIAHAIIGSCGQHTYNYDGNSRAAFGIAFHQSVYFNAGDKIYLFGKIAGMGFKSHPDSSSDEPRDIDVYVTQTNNEFKIVKQ